MIDGDEFGSTIAPAFDQVDKLKEPLPTFTIISHPDPSRIGDIFYLRGMHVSLSRLEPVFNKPGQAIQGKALVDPFVSRKPMSIERNANGIVFHATSSCRIEIEGDILENSRAFDTKALRAGIVIVLAERVVLLAHEATPDPKIPTMHSIVGFSDGILAVHEEIERIAPLKVPVLIMGPSGSGKELVAQAIHRASLISGPWISVNMGAIASNLAASEMFGSVKGAFTGAHRDQPGYLRAAHKGTLFLDEIGEMPQEIQVLLLRALETGEVSPVGSQAILPFQTRLITATDADLQEKIENNSFKEPLFHRVAGYEIKLPGLKERREDLGRLILHFVREESKALGVDMVSKVYDPYAKPWISTSLVTRLLAFPWPGNVRQLRNVVRQLVIGCWKDDQLRLLPKIAEILDRIPTKRTENHVQHDFKTVTKPAELQKQDVLNALRANHWDIKAAADALGISRGMIYVWIKKMPEVRKGSDLDADEILEALERNNHKMEAAAAELEVSARALRRRYNQLNLG